MDYLRVGDADSLLSVPVVWYDTVDLREVLPVHHNLANLFPLQLLENGDGSPQESGEARLRVVL